MHTHFRCFNQNGNAFLLFFPNCPGADAETEEKRGDRGDVGGVRRQSDQ